MNSLFIYFSVAEFTIIDDVRNASEMPARSSLNPLGNSGDNRLCQLNPRSPLLVLAFLVRRIIPRRRPFTKPLRDRRGSVFIIASARARAPLVSRLSPRNGVLIITRRINPREPVGTHLRGSACPFAWAYANLRRWKDRLSRGRFLCARALIFTRCSRIHRRPPYRGKPAGKCEKRFPAVGEATSL